MPPEWIIAGSSPVKRNRPARVMAAGIAGNVLEWYDFAIYGFFAPVIGKLFFPSDDPATSLIAAFGAFAAGFLMRPLGAVIFGHIGDRIGRRKVMIISVMMMAIPVFLIGILPTHAEIGVAAAILMVLLRMLQGLSVGGEYVGSFVFLLENAPKKRRGVFCCGSFLGLILGVLLGSAVGALVSDLASPETIADWAWRIPFVSGLVVAIVALMIRRGIPEQPLPAERARAPLFEAVRDHWRTMLQAAGLNMIGAIVFYAGFVYIATWLAQQTSLSRAEALNINTINLVVLAAFALPAAALSDRIGRKPVLVASSAGFVLLVYPLIWMMDHDNAWLVFFGQFGLAVLLSSFVAVVPATISEMFPWRVRVSAASVSLNVPYAIFGGTAPLVAAWLVTKTGNPLSIAWYLMAAAFLSLIVSLTLPKPRNDGPDDGI